MVPTFLIFFRFDGWFYSAEVRVLDTLFDVCYWVPGLVGVPVLVQVASVNGYWHQIEDTNMESPEFIHSIGRSIEQASE